MAINDLLQDFGSAIPGAERLTVLSEAAMEEQNLQNFEKGYAAGWEDSLAMQIEEKSRLSEAMSQNLEDLRFTYAEALQQLTRAVVPVLQGAVSQLLPEIMSRSLAPMIQAEMQEILLRLGDQPVLICVPPGMASHVRPVVGHALGQTVDVVEADFLTEGQAAIRVGTVEREIDLSASVAAISGAVDAYAAELDLEEQHG